MATDRNATNLYVDRRKLALFKSDETQTTLAAAWGCSRSLVSQIILGQCRSHDREKLFAKAMDLTYDHLFVAAPVRSRDRIEV